MTNILGDHFGFGGKSPVPAHPEADTLATALIELAISDKALLNARCHVPDYTGQWDAQDYYADEQERRNRAADNVRDIIKGMIRETIEDIHS